MNCKAFADKMMSSDLNFDLVSRGTDNHMFLVDLKRSAKL